MSTDAATSATANMMKVVMKVRHDSIRNLQEIWPVQKTLENWKQSPGGVVQKYLQDNKTTTTKKKPATKVKKLYPNRLHHR